MRQLRVFLFGPPRIEFGGRRIEIGLRKAVALFVYLVVNKQPYSRDALATLFWPKTGQQTALGNLRRALHRLNAAFDGELLAATRKTVEINPQVDLWLDTREFEQKVSACFSASLQPGRPFSGSWPEEAVCLPELEKAAALYTQDFLAGFSLLDSPDFDEWQFF